MNPKRNESMNPSVKVPNFNWWPFAGDQRLKKPLRKFKFFCETLRVYFVERLQNVRVFKTFHHDLHKLIWYKNLKNFMAPFYGWGSTASRLQPLRGGSLLFTIQFPEIPGTHFIDLGRIKGWFDLGATHWFWTRDFWIGNPAPGLGIQRLNH